jgi:gamma-glutamylcyclotransferase (GGCT)/AIG2-like uncharacterized protein YtfP
MLLFVYGSLRKGLQNHPLLEQATYIGEYTTQTSYIMIGTKSKSFPYLIKGHTLPTLAPTPITGELYDIPPTLIERLDALEDNPYTYTRQLISHDPPIEAYIVDNLILINQIKKWIGKRFVYISSGDWKQYYSTNKS